MPIVRSVINPFSRKSPQQRPLPAILPPCHHPAPSSYAPAFPDFLPFSPTRPKKSVRDNVFVNKSINCLPILNIFSVFFCCFGVVWRGRKERKSLPQTTHNVFISRKGERRNCEVGIIYLQPLSFSYVSP
jgi:hypothetical protein